MPLTADDIDELYRAHARSLLAFLARRTWDPEAAVDLVAETFATAIDERSRFRGGSSAEAAGWLYGIARHQLSGWYRRGDIERRAMRRVGIEVRDLTGEELDRIVELAGLDEARRAVAASLESFGEDARAALRLRVVEERSYAEVAAALGVSGQTARARVSRALRALAEELSDVEAEIHG